MNIRKTIIQVLLFCVVSVCFAQTHTMSVSDFRYVPESTEANTSGTIVKDKNGDKCALIKVQTTIVDLNFDAGLMYVETKQKSGEIWVYVQAGANRLSISHAQLGKVDYPLPMTLQKARVYELDLVANMASGGSLQVSAYPHGADVYLDGKQYGQTPIYIPSLIDEYDLEIKKEGYKTISRRVSIPKGEVVAVADTLEKYIALHVNESAEIYIDKERQGISTWQGYLKVGQHLIECRKDRHQSTSVILDIDDKTPNSLNLGAPTPITGSLSVSGNVTGAEVYIDGERMGFTPVNLKNVLIGSHSIEVKHPNYKTYSSTVEVKRNERVSHTFTMDETCSVIITSNPSGATLSIDGNNVGKTPYTFHGTVGEHRITMNARNYNEYDEKVYLSNAKNEVRVALKYVYLYKNQLYFDIGASFLSATSIGASIGGYWNNVNAEVSASYGLGNGETFYWTSIDRTQSEERTYSPGLRIGGKFGYGIIIASRFRITPQVGVATISLTNSGGNATSVTGTLKFAAAVGKHFGIFVAPEYSHRIACSESYEALSKVSNKINSLSKGFNLSAGMSFFF